MNNFEFIKGNYETKKQNSIIKFLISEAETKKEQYLYEEFNKVLNELQLKYEKIEDEINKLAEFILKNIEGEPKHNESAVDCAIRLLSERDVEI